MGPHSSTLPWVGGGECPSLPPQWNKYRITSFDNFSLEGRLPPQGAWWVFPCQELPEMAAERFNYNLPAAPWGTDPAWPHPRLGRL